VRAGRWRGGDLARRGARRHAAAAKGASDRTRAEVRDKLQALRKELHTSATYTVRQCVSDWLSEGLDVRSPKTVPTYRRCWIH
jgi:hypothetical protein